MNGLQDWTPYAGRPVGNSPKSVPLDNSVNRDNSLPLRFHCVPRAIVFWTGREPKRRRGLCVLIFFLHKKGNRQRTQAYTGIENGGTPSFQRGLSEMFNLALRALEIVYNENGAAV